MMPFIIIVVGVAIVAGAYFWGARASAHPKHSMITIRDREIPVEVRDDTFGRAQGLSGRQSLAAGSGMLFIFPRAADYGFWMKDMNFGVDIIWIEGGKIVGISERLMPEPEKSLLTLTVYHPPQAVQYVLEVPAGTAQEYGLQIGDPVNL